MSEMQRPLPLIRGAAVRRTKAGTPIIIGDTRAVLAEVSRARRAREWEPVQAGIYTQDGIAWTEIRYLPRRRPIGLAIAIVVSALALMALIAAVVWSLTGTALIGLAGALVILMAWRVLDRPTSPSVSVNVDVEVNR